MAVVGVSRRVLADDVYTALKGMIMDQQIAPGSKVNIDQVARELDVSITPVREALSRLESDELVIKEPLRGFYAHRQISKDEFRDLCVFRRAIEGWVSAEAAANATEADQTRLADEIAAVPLPVRGGSYENYRSFQDHDERFHDIIFAIAGNQTARTAFARTHAHLRTFRVGFEAGAGELALGEHGRILQAIASHDPEGARAAMVAHLENTEARLLPFLR